MTFSRPLLKLSANGAALDLPPIQFRMRTDMDEPGVVAELEFPHPGPPVRPGEPVTVDMVHDGSSVSRIFTGELVKNIPVDRRRLFVLADDSQKLQESKFRAAYRDERDESIIKDILRSAGIDEGKITAPGILFARFSIPETQGSRALAMLLKSLPAYGESGDYRYFFDKMNVFQFGTPKSANNGGERVNLSSKADIISHRGDTITIAPRPIRHSMRVAIDGAERWVARSDLIISPKRSRLALQLGASP